MKAIVRSSYGGPEAIQIQDIPIPKIGANDVLVKVHACTVNRTDCGVLTGKPYVIRAFIGLRSPRLKTLGTDFAGEVESVGSEVTNFEVGDRVWGLNDEGLQSNAQFMCIKASEGISKIPPSISFTEAVAGVEGGHYAYNFINKLKINENSKVLINGATGAIGSAALQLLKSRNIFVTAVGNTKNLNMLQRLGADKVIDYETQDFTKDNETYDFVFDAVGKSTFAKCKPLFKDRGIYVSSELGPNWQNLYLPLFRIFHKKRVVFPIPTNTKASIEHMSALMEKGTYKGVIDKIYRMDQIKEAYRYTMSGQKTGQIILKIDH